VPAAKDEAVSRSIIRLKRTPAPSSGARLTSSAETLAAGGNGRAAALFNAPSRASAAFDPDRPDGQGYVRGWQRRALSRSCTDQPARTEVLALISPASLGINGSKIK
jgi:hypothetical protein